MNLTTFIAELEKLEKAATPGEWKHEEERYSARNVIGVKPADDRWIASCQPEFNGYGNAEFIAHSRNALPKLLACVKVLSEAVGFYSVGKLHLDYEKFQTGKGAPNHVVGKFARQALSKCESIIAGEK